MKLRILLCFIGVIYSSISNATVFQAIGNGLWSNAENWDVGYVPSNSSDTVIIDGFSILLSNNMGSITVASLFISNESGEKSDLLLEGNTALTILNNLEVVAANEEKEVEFILEDNANLYVTGDVNFRRTEDNFSENRLRLRLKDEAQMEVGGDFTFDYKNADDGEDNSEIYLNGAATLDITGNTNFFIRNGKDFELKIEDSAQVILRQNLDAQMSGGDNLIISTKGSASILIQGDATISNSGGANKALLLAEESAGTIKVNGDLNLLSETLDKTVYVELNGADSYIDVRGDVLMNAMSDGDVYIHLKSTSKMNLGGTFLRPSQYGAFHMGVGTTLDLNGSQSSQTMTSVNLEGSGTDAFNFRCIRLDNPFGFVLEDSLSIIDNLHFIEGKITTTEDKILIIEDQAVITGANPTSYVNGPIIKQGRSEMPFLFPVGNESVYAPISVSPITNQALELQASYDGDPPPFGAFLAEGITELNTSQYWYLSKSMDVDLDVSLHWSDASLQGIESLDNLIVTGLTSDNIWESYGQGEISGGVGNGASGYVSSVAGDPPPFGIAQFAIGIREEGTTSLGDDFNNANTNFYLMPNPVDQSLILKAEVSDHEKFMLEVYDGLGQKMFKQQISFKNGLLELDAEAIQVTKPGAYFLNIVGSSSRKTLKFIKAN